MQTWMKQRGHFSKESREKQSAWYRRAPQANFSQLQTQQKLQKPK